eukprot:scaffold4034_cov179-Amphora_coffeaeformis.AAC.1
MYVCICVHACVRACVYAVDDSGKRIKEFTPCRSFDAIVCGAGTRLVDTFCAFSLCSGDGRHPVAQSLLLIGTTRMARNDYDYGDVSNDDDNRQ